jgi:hypothetical protein
LLAISTKRQAAVVAAAVVEQFLSYSTNPSARALTAHDARPAWPVPRTVHPPAHFTFLQLTAGCQGIRLKEMSIVDREEEEEEEEH